MAKLKAKDYKNRKALERDVEGRDPKKDTIEGTRAELAQLGLSDKNTVFGVPVVITDSPTEKVKQNKRPDRGEVRKGAIVGK